MRLVWFVLALGFASAASVQPSATTSTTNGTDDKVSSAGQNNQAAINIEGNSHIEFGFGNDGKAENAGQMSYQGHTECLDIIGAGQAFDSPSNMCVTVHNRLTIGGGEAPGSIDVPNGDVSATDIYATRQLAAVHVDVQETLTVGERGLNGASGGVGNIRATGQIVAKSLQVTGTMFVAEEVTMAGNLRVAGEVNLEKNLIVDSKDILAELNDIRKELDLIKAEYVKKADLGAIPGVCRAA